MEISFVNANISLLVFRTFPVFAMFQNNQLKIIFMPKSHILGQHIL